MHSFPVPYPALSSDPLGAGAAQGQTDFLLVPPRRDFAFGTRASLCSFMFPQGCTKTIQILLCRTSAWQVLSSTYLCNRCSSVSTSNTQEHFLLGAILIFMLISPVFPKHPSRVPVFPRKEYNCSSASGWGLLRSPASKEVSVNLPFLSLWLLNISWACCVYTFGKELQSCVTCCMKNHLLLLLKLLSGS